MGRGLDALEACCLLWVDYVTATTGSLPKGVPDLSLGVAKPA